MSNVTVEELRQDFNNQTCKKLIDYVDRHGEDGLKKRMLNLIKDGLIEPTDVDEIIKFQPIECESNSNNFGLGALDDNDNLLNRAVHSNPDIIEGVLKTDTTGMFIGASKSYKTWHLIRLALAVSHGQPWFGCNTRKSKVLFVNPELIPNEFQSRVQSVARDMGLDNFDDANFKSLSLHKKFLAPDALMDAIENLVAKDKYELVILDSLYRLYGPRIDENSNADMLRLLVRMEKMSSRPNSALIFSHHSPKGEQSGKRSIDVAAGGGALGRFVATCITTRIVEEDENRYSLEFVSRYHKRKESVGLVMNGPKATVDAAFNRSELNGNNRYNNEDILCILEQGAYTAGKLQKALKKEIGMSKSAFYGTYWPKVQKMDGLQCNDSREYCYVRPASGVVAGRTTTATNHA